MSTAFPYIVAVLMVAALCAPGPISTLVRGLILSPLMFAGVLRSDEVYQLISW